MAQGFSLHRQQSKQAQAITTLKHYRDKILGLAWLGYLQQGIGAIRFREADSEGEITYVPRSQLFDEDVCRIVEKNDPTQAAVVLYDHGTWCSILTLSGAKSPSACYEELPEILKQSALTDTCENEWG